MAFEAVDVHTGEPHITSDDVADLNVAATGLSNCVFSWGNKFESSLADANTVSIGTGAGMVAGRRFVNRAPVTVTLQSGSQGVGRIDVVVARYSKASDGTESIVPAVVQGEPSASGLKWPDIGDDELELCYVEFEGVTPKQPEPLYYLLLTTSQISGYLHKRNMQTAMVGEWGSMITESSVDGVRWSIRGNAWWRLTTTAWNAMKRPPGLSVGSSWYVKTPFKLETAPAEAYEVEGMGFAFSGDWTSSNNLATVSVAVGTDGYLYIGRWSSNPGDIPLVIVMYGYEVDASMY